MESKEEREDKRLRPW